MGSLKKVVKKVAKPEVLLPAAALLIGGPMAAKAIAAKGGLGAALTGTAGTAGVAGLPAIGGGAATAAAGVPATAGLFGTAGAFAPLKGTLAKGIATGLANPFSKAGLATYGSAGLGLAALMGKEKTEAQKNLGVDAQAQYDMARMYNQMMGNALTDEQLNVAVAPMLSQYGGEYETFTGPKRKRRPMFPGLNYSGLTRSYAADGGSIMPIARDLPDPLSDNEPDMETLQGIKDYIDYLNDMDAAREAMAERVPNPTGRADGGLMQLASAPDPMSERRDMLENLALDMYKRPLEELKPKEIELLEGMIEEMDYGMADGGLMQLAGSAGDRPTMEDADEHSFRLFNKPYKELTIDELDEFEEEMARLRSKFMADGGSIPQTEDIPNGMQLDGRGGGFIPMGAKERKDDVPAMLAKNEFVMTADAVRAAGGGDVNKGAQKMYDLMNNLESKV
jgi:hypothetical protein